MGVRMLDATRFAVDVFRELTADARRQRLNELESAVNEQLSRCATLGEFQKRLYAIVDELNTLGHFLGRWEYDCEIEYFGGRSYLDRSIPDELLLKSEYPHGVRLNWGEFAFEDWS